MNTIYNYNYKNAPKNVKNSEAKEEKSRKTRSYQEGREFICGACKSGYLSYPALSTHIKTKHNGIYPEGTIRAKTTTTRKGDARSIYAASKTAYPAVQARAGVRVPSRIL